MLMEDQDRVIHIIAFLVESMKQLMQVKNGDVNQLIAVLVI